MKLGVETEQEDEEKIDLAELAKNYYNLVKKNRWVILIGVLVLISAVGLYTRTRNFGILGDNVLALDPWLFNRYTEYIVEHGSLMKNDTMRYYPQGYDTSRESTILPYLLAYTYKALSIVMPDLSVTTVVQLYPPVITIFTILFLFLLGTKFFDWRVGLLAASLIAIAPGFLFRTIAGFSDKDALSMTFFVMSMAFYLGAMREKSKNKFYAYTIASGVSIALLGMTWGGYLLVVYAIAALNMLKAVTSNVTRRDLILQGGWIFFLTISDLFTNRYNIFKELPYEMAVLAFLACLIEFFLWPYAEKRIKNIRKFPTGILSLILAVMVSGVFGLILLGPSHIGTMVVAVLARIPDPLGGGEAMGQSVSENQQPYFNPDWMSHLGHISLGAYKVPLLLSLFLIGLVLLFHETFRKVKTGKSITKYYLTLGFSAFIFVVIFSRYKIGSRITDLLSAPLPIISKSPFELSIPAFGILALIYIVTVWRKKGVEAFKDIDQTKALMVLWSFLLVLGARGAVRLLFPLVPAVAIVGSYTVVRMSDFIKSKLKDPLYNYIPYILIAIVLVSYYHQSSASAAFYGPSTIGDWAQSYSWIKENTPENAVFIHWWDYGYWIQGVANRTTVTDGGNSYPYKNYLMGRHLFGGYNISEVYNQLVNFSRPDYFYVVSDDIGKFYQMARIGERNTYYTNIVYQQKVANTGFVNVTEYPELLVFQPLGGGLMVQKDFTINSRIYASGSTFVVGVLVPIKTSQELGEPLVIVYNQQYGQEIMQPLGFCSPNEPCTKARDVGVPGYINLIKNGMIWIPEKAKDMFMTQSYLLNRTIPGFELVWESSADLYDMQTILGGRQNIRVYKLNYTAMEDAISRGVEW